MKHGNKGGYSNSRNSGGYQSRYNDRPRFGGNSRSEKSFDRGDRKPRTMHEASCSNCNKDCQVPFRPTGDKPVLCSNCFEKKGGNSFGRDRQFESKGRGNHSFSREKSPARPDPRIAELQAELRSVQSKLDTIVSLLKEKNKNVFEDTIILEEETMAPIKKIAKKTKNVLAKKEVKLKKEVKTRKKSDAS